MTSNTGATPRVPMAGSAAASANTRPVVRPWQSRTELRRPMVIIGVALSLLLGIVTVRAAAGWAATTAPLSVAPASLSSIDQALVGERARSAALQAQLGSLRASSDQLLAALGAANDRLAQDQTTADGLRTSLAAAQQKLATLEAALKAAAARAPTGPMTPRAPSTGSGIEPGDD